MTSKEQTAHDMALACRFCRTPTDYEFDKKDNLWVTRCECGKIDYHDVDEISKDVEYLIEALGKVHKK
jgi:hypothetical protein